MCAAVLQIGLVEEWLADELEAKGFDTIEDARDFVISRLQPPEKRTLALKEFHDSRIRLNESPREAAERMKRLVREAMPEAENETIEMLVKAQMIEAAPNVWKGKLYEAPLDSLDVLISKMEVFRKTETSVRRVNGVGQQRSDERFRGRGQNFNTHKSYPQATHRPPNSNTVICFACKKPGHFARDCKEKRCYNCREVAGHLAKDCPKGSRIKRVEVVNASLYENTNQTASHPEDDIVIDVSVDGRPIHAVVDTGSPFSIMNEETALALSLGSHAGTVSHTLRGIDGGKLEVIGEVLIWLEINGKQQEVPVCIVKNVNDSLILGRDVLKNFKILVDCEDNSCSMKRVTCQGRRETSPRITGAEHEIVTTTDTPISTKPYKVPVHYAEKVNEMLVEMEEADIIRKSNSPYAFPVVIVPKPHSDELRLTVDYRKLNEVTVNDPYPMPDLRRLVQQAANAKHFTVLDVEKGFWQVPMKEQDCHKTAFVVNDCHYEFSVMPFGLKNASKTFQRIMNEIAENINKRAEKVCVFAYIDDVLIFSDTAEEHEHHIKLALSELEERGVVLNEKKCVWRKTAVQYLGYHISHQSIKAREQFAEEVENWDEPKDVNELRRFLGFTGFYRECIPQYATITHELTEMLKKNREFEWTEKQTEAFYKLKEAVKDAPRRYSLDVNRPVIMVTDASGIGWGATLEQDGHPINFASGKWNSTEQGYSTTKRELRACVNAIKVFQWQIVGAPDITWVTDHLPCKNIQPNLLDPVLFRWWNKIHSLGVKICHKPGAEIPQADALSRKTVRLVKAGDEWKTAMKNDTALMWAIRVKEGSADRHDHNNEAEKVRYFQLMDKLSVKEGNLYFENKMVVPRDLRAEMIQKAHKGHMGRKRTSQLVNERYWWPGWHRASDDFVSSCIVCAKSKYKRSSHKSEGVGSIEVRGEPFSQWSLDIKGPLPVTKQNNRYILVATDLFTKWIELYPIADQQAKTIADRVLDLVCRYSVPKEVLTDQGSNFQSILFRELCDYLGVKKLRTTAWNPRCNGEVERVNSTLGEMLRCHVEEKQDDWDRFLSVIAYNYRITKHSVTQFSPFQLVFGRTPRSSLDEYVEVDRGTRTYCSDLDDACRQAAEWREQALERIVEAKSRTSCAASDAGFKVGEYVMVRKYWIEPGAVRKLSPYFDGPFAVVQVDRPDYLIQVGSQRKRVHGRNLKRYHMQVSHEDQEESNDCILETSDASEEGDRSEEEHSDDEEDEDPFAFVRGTSRYGRVRKRRVLE